MLGGLFTAAYRRLLLSIQSKAAPITIFYSRFVQLRRFTGFDIDHVDIDRVVAGTRKGRFVFVRAPLQVTRFQVGG